MPLNLVFKFRRGCLPAFQLYYFETKLPNLKLKTRPKQLLGSHPVDIALPGISPDKVDIKYPGAYSKHFVTHE